MSFLRSKRVRGGIGGFDTDSDEEVEVDMSATLTSGRVDIGYTEHVSKKKKQSHTCGHTLLGSSTDSQGSTEVQEPIQLSSTSEGKLRKQVRSFLFQTVLSDELVL
jgi:hypothetical protein